MASGPSEAAQDDPVVELPHVVMHSSKRVGHGRRTTVSGWLGIADGTALAGQVVRVLTAPDNGLGSSRSGRGGDHGG